MEEIVSPSVPCVQEEILLSLSFRLNVIIIFSSGIWLHRTKKKRRNEEKKRIIMISGSWFDDGWPSHYYLKLLEESRQEARGSTSAASGSCCLGPEWDDHLGKLISLPRSKKKKQRITIIRSVGKSAFLSARPARHSHQLPTVRKHTRHSHNQEERKKEIIVRALTKSSYSGTWTIHYLPDLFLSSSHIFKSRVTIK